MKVTIEIEITGEQIAVLMTSFVESGDAVTRGWCARVENRSDKPITEPWWYADKGYFEGEFSFAVFEIEDESSDDVKEHVIDQTKMAAGLLIMAQKHPESFADIIRDNADAGTADTFMQCVVLGEEVYA